MNTDKKHSCRQRQKLVTKSADNPSVADHGFHVVMLMAMQKKPRLAAGQIIVKGGKADMDLVIPIVDQAWRVMGKKNVHRRELRHRSFDFLLLKQIMASGFVFPGAAETTKGKPAKLKCLQMQISDGCRKRGTRIVVALHGENFGTTGAVGNFQDDFVRHVTERYQHVNGAGRSPKRSEFVVRDNEQVQLVVRIAERMGKSLGDQRTCQHINP